MKTNRKILLLLLFTGVLCSIRLTAEAQISVNFSPVIYGQTLDGLVYAQIVNSYQGDLKAKLTIKVREMRGADVLTIKTPSFIIRPGVNVINKAAFSAARFSFGNNNFGLTVSQTGRFLEGEYEYCFEVDISESKNNTLPPIFENCFIQHLQPRTPLLLINPVDGDEFCNKHPQFMWQPPQPLPREARFRFQLTEVKEKQDIAEAIAYNLPLVNQANIMGNSLFYPVSAPELKEGHQYAWQVIVYTAKSILARSEIWTFTYKCNEEKKEVITDSYREINETEDGNFYVANTWLRFSLTNPYAAGDLNYTISSMSDASKSIKGLQKLKMAPGLNKYDLDLSENRQFKNDEEYILKVYLANNRVLKLRFIYKNE